MRQVFMTVLALVLIAATGVATGQESAFDAHRFWTPDERSGQAEYERALLDVMSASSLKANHELLASVPHRAGTEGDLLTVERIAQMFESYGLEVEKHPVPAYLARPVDATLEIIRPERISLPLRERPLNEDPDSADERLEPGWNAFSGSGDVAGRVVYANYGRKQDFEKLEELGVSVRGRIVIARYGGNYRGKKAKFAEEAGAIGLIMYTDPADSGYARGPVYPEGGWANGSYIQRGSISTLAQPGDPQTPFKESREGVERVDPRELDLPTIPVQPIGYDAASEILSRMRGAPVPSGWQGALPFAYRVEGGRELRVRLRVEQAREVIETFNVIGRLEGARWPDEQVIIGSHHDAWNFGAADPLAGTICTIEAARAFGELASRGMPPQRTVLFCAWAAEEYSLVGSTEWVEGRFTDLLQSAVAYINLDMAAMGPEFGASAAPSLKRVVAEVARQVPQAREPGATVYEKWIARGTDPLVSNEPKLGDLGGGSDHEAFYCYAGIPSVGMGAGGSKGAAYHSAYDTIAWYQKIVGDDYEPALMVSRMAGLTAARLANASVLPIDASRIGTDARRHVADLSELAESKGFLSAGAGLSDHGRPIASELARLVGAAAQLENVAKRVEEAALERLEAGRLDDGSLSTVNRALLTAERTMLIQSGLPERRWFRNQFAAEDMDSGYSAWMLPWVRYAIEREDTGALTAGEFSLLKAIVQLTGQLERLESQLPPLEAPAETETEMGPVGPRPQGG